MITEALCTKPGQFYLKISLTNISLLTCLFYTSAGKPKRPHALKTICLMLGPDFITDIIEVGMSYVGNFSLLTVSI